MGIMAIGMNFSLYVTLSDSISFAWDNRMIYGISDRYSYKAQIDIYDQYHAFILQIVTTVSMLFYPL